MAIAALDSLDLTTLQSMRASALTALQRLSEGSQIVGVQGIGRSTTFSQANRRDLLAWINDLEAAIRQKTTGQSSAGPLIPEI